MKKQLTNIGAYLVIIISFLLLPKMMKDTGSAMFLLLTLYPIIFFALSVITTIIDDKNMGIPVYIFFTFIFLVKYELGGQYDTMIYGVIYSLASIIGMYITYYIKNRRSTETSGRTKKELPRKETSRRRVSRNLNTPRSNGERF